MPHFAARGILSRILLLSSSTRINVSADDFGLYRRKARFLPAGSICHHYDFAAHSKSDSAADSIVSNAVA